MKNVIAWVGWLGVMTACGSAAPGPPATSQSSSTRAPSAPMPDEFKPLVARSVFVRRSTPSSMAAAARLAGAAWALRGVVRDDAGGYIAIVEDPTTHQIQELENGAALAGGNISHISLRGFQYEMGGKNNAVAIGHTLSGEPAVLAPPAPATAVASGAKGHNGPTTVPSNGVDASPEAAKAALVAELSDPAGADPTTAVPHDEPRRRKQPSNNN